MSEWCTLMHPGGNDVLRKIVYSQPASDSSDSLFFIRKMRCEGTHFGVKFSYAPLWQALRAIHACSRSSRGGERNGVRTPILGRFWAF